MRKQLIIITFLLLSTAAAAIPGDTIIVRSHNRVDQTWYGNYDRVGAFPPAKKTFRKILMKYTLSCPSSGCSDWDYDVNIWLMHNTGKIDTVVDRYDTISQNPLLVDTVWKYNKVYNPFELGRYITPYGTYMNKRSPSHGTAGYDSTWKHDFIYDVTDFAMLLHDSVLIRSQYRGWSSGFQCTIDFIFIEGTPPRKVLSIQNLYTSGGTYTTPAEFESLRMPAKKLYIAPDADDAEVKVIITGHGADNNGCGEFCDKNYYFKVNEMVVDTMRMWRDDCGLNAVKPQGGTWIFDRGNWCPGDKIYPFYHHLKKYITPGDSLLLDIDLDPSIATGNNKASYNASAILFTYAAPSFNNDATVAEIMSPSNASEYRHWNPVCNNPMVVIQNTGAKPLTWANIVYGVKGGKKRNYVWKGNLLFMQRDTLILPTPLWDGVNFTDNIFEASVEQANHKYSDEYTLNDLCVSRFNPVPRLGAFTLMMRTNGVPEENKLTITNSNGETVFLMEKLDPFKIYTYDLNLPDGCYQLLLTDEGKDGLHFWYYSNIGETKRTGGWLRLNKQGGGSYMLPNGDFGTEVRYNFVVGNMTIPEVSVIRDELKVFPNPASNEIKVQIPQSVYEHGSLKLSVIDATGRKVYEKDGINADKAYWYTMSTLGFSPGMYTIIAEISSYAFEQPAITESVKTKIVITR